MVAVSVAPYGLLVANTLHTLQLFMYFLTRLLKRGIQQYSLILANRMSYAEMVVFLVNMLNYVRDELFVF